MIGLKKRSLWELGRIEALSPQGEKLYAKIRRIGDIAKDIEGNTVRINSYLFGNLDNLPEACLTLAEVLIRIDIDLSISKSNSDSLLNRYVMVLIEGGVPVRAKLIDEETSRIIDPNDIRQARKLSADPSKIDLNGMSFLESLGYAWTQIEGIIAESIGNNNIDGKTMKYGNQSTYDAISKSEQSLRYDASASLPLATNIPASQLKNKTCHIHIKAFSAK